MKLALLGARGFIGSRFRSLLDSKCQVLAWDMDEAARVESLLRESKPKLVVNTAAAGVTAASRDPASLFDSNIKLPAALAEYCLAEGVPLLHFGTGFEYGFSDEPARGTEAPVRGRRMDPYGVSKAAGARLLETLFAGRNGLLKILRPFQVFGEGEKPPRLLPALVEAAEREEPFVVRSPGSIRSFTYVEDVASFCVPLIERAASRGEFSGDAVVNLAPEPRTTVREFVGAARDALSGHGLEADVRFGDDPPLSSYLSEAEACPRWEGYLGIEEGLRRAVARMLKKEA